MERYCYRCEKDVELRKDANSNAQLCAVCGAVIIHSANYLPPGTMLGGFRIVDELGRGGMGIVYRARQLNLERDVALKVLADDLANDREFVERFFKEARAAASLNHPNIVQVFDAGRSPEGVSFFAMELIEGETLETSIESHGKLAPKEALKIAVKIADALDYAWKFQKLTHGDIKPDNIILNNAGSAKLADLGLAKFVHDDNFEDGIMATPLYAPPEVIKGEVELIGFHSDMYSFGATLYQMLTGVPPFPDNDPEVIFQQHLNDTPSPLLSYNSKLAPALVEICEQMLAKSPENRPETWEAVHLALKKIREPEVSKKVFHTHLHIDPAASIVSDKKLSLIVKSLLSVIIILGVGVVAMLFLKQEDSEGKSGKIRIANPEVVIAEWNKLKKEIFKKNPTIALKKVKNFIEDHDNDVPSEALSRLKTLEARVVTIEGNRKRRASEQAQFEKRVNAVLVSVKAVNIDSQKTPIAEMQDLNKKLQDILRKASDVSYLMFPLGSKTFLTDVYKKLSDRLRQHREKMDEIRNEKIAKEQLGKLELERETLSQEKEDHQTQLALNGTINNYYIALDGFRNGNSLTTLKSGLQEWDQGSDVIAPQYTIRVEFFTSTILPSAGKIISLIKSKESYFNNKKLPPEMCSKKLKNYSVRAFTDKGIKLAYHNNAKVTLGHTMQWASISHKHLILLLKEGVLSVENALTGEENNVILSFTLLFVPDSFLDIFNNVQNLTKRNQKCWESIKKDFDISSNEVQCITLLKMIDDALKAKEYSKAVTLFCQLSKAPRGSLFASRYEIILPQIKAQLHKYTPELTAIDQIQNIPQVPVSAEKRFNAAMVIRARYSNCLLKLNANEIDHLNATQKKAKLALARVSGVKRLSDNRIPFYYWTKEKQGAAQAFLDIVIKSNKLKFQPVALQAMKLSTALDNGDWPLVYAIFNSKKISNIANTVTPTTIKSWKSALIFAYGLADMQLGNGSARAKIHQMMETQYSHYKTGAMAPLILSLIFEYDLLTRQTRFPLLTSATYNYQALSSYAMSVKVGLLGLQACIESNHPLNIPKFQSLSGRLHDVYGAQVKFRGDLKFVTAAGELLNQQALRKSQINELMLLKCYHSDTSAKVLIAALARYHTMNGAIFAGEELLINSLEKKVTPLLVSGDLWRKVLLLKMANNPYAGDVKKITVAGLNRAEICTTRFYPGLLMLNAGAEYALGNYSKEEVKNFLMQYFSASSLVSKKDVEDLNVVTDSEPSLIIARLFKEHQPEKAFSYGILGIMVHCKNPLVKSKIVKVMNVNNNALSWEERYLIKQIQNWR